MRRHNKWSPGCTTDKTTDRLSLIWVVVLGIAAVIFLVAAVMAILINGFVLKAREVVGLGPRFGPIGVGP